MKKITKIMAILTLLLLSSIPEITFAYQTGGNCGFPDVDRRGRPEAYQTYMQKCMDNVQNKINSAIGRTSATGVSQGAYLFPIGRQQDIFVFCKYGMNSYPDIHYWQALNPSTGTYTITNYYYVNIQYIPAYVAICPLGGRTPGNWQTGGTGGEVKGNTSPQIPLHIPFIH